jgi:hypothetical protein
MTGDGTGAVLLLVLLVLAAPQLLSARARNSRSGAEATVSPATMATALRPSCSIACLAANKAATLQSRRVLLCCSTAAAFATNSQGCCCLFLVNGGGAALWEFEKCHS